tara:strand:- start:12797 stop:12958 length:162 start_codon:yes stop_codon:yes gene_type:complete
MISCTAEITPAIAALEISAAITTEISPGWLASSATLPFILNRLEKNGSHAANY